MQRELLAKVLEACKPALATKEMITQSTCFCFTGEKVITYNDAVAIQVPFPSDFVGAVGATELHGFVSRAKGDTLEFEVEGESVTVKCGRARCGIPFQETVQLPLEEITHEEKYKKLPSDFGQAVMFVSPTVSRDYSKQLLTCVHINAEGAETCDGFRLAKHTFANDGKLSHDFLLPGAIAKEVVKFNPSLYAISGGWVHFKNAEASVMSCRIFSEEYPNTASHLQLGQTISIEFPSEIEEMIERASAFFKEDNDRDEQILLNFSKNKLEISCETPRGWFKEASRVSYAGEPIVLGVTPSFLRGILKDSRTAVVDTTKMLFAENNWQYLTLLRTIK